MSRKLNSSASGIATKLIAIITSLCVMFFVIGTIEFGGHYPRLTDASFHSLQLFHLHFPEHIEPVSLPLEIARWGAGLLGLSVIPLLLGLLLGDRFFRYWVRFLWRNHVIVCGDSVQAYHLLSDLRQSKHRVVFIGTSAGSRANLPRGVLFLEGHARDGRLLRTAAAQRAAHVVALSDDRANLDILDAVTQICEARRAGMGALNCHAHIQDVHLESGLRHALAQTSDKSSGVRYHLFNSHEESARLLACRYPLPEALVESEPLPEHYVIVGFGALGQNVALKLVKMGQQLFHEPGAPEDSAWRIINPRITVVDPRGEDAASAFLHGTPTFRDHCDFKVVALSCETSDFLSLAFLDRGGHRGKTSLILCIDDETMALRTALMLLKGRSASEAGIDAIYLHLREPERLHLILEGSPGHPRLAFFAPDREVFSSDAILRGSLDTLARAVHEAWLTAEQNDRRAENQASAAAKIWEELSEHDRDSNREAADHTWAKLRTLGYELQPARGKTASHGIDPAFLAELKAHEDELARVEHYRWMTWRLLDGWRYGKERDPALKCHPDIKAYEDLAKSTQDKDKAIIRAIPKLLQAGRLEIRKIALSIPSSAMKTK
ncbi:MAG: RyR domain-containing protein [Verrucomicrobiota bacterium]